MTRDEWADAANDIANALGGWSNTIAFVKDVDKLSTERWLLFSMARLYLKPTQRDF